MKNQEKFLLVLEQQLNACNAGVEAVCEADDLRGLYRETVRKYPERIVWLMISLQPSFADIFEAQLCDNIQLWRAKGLAQKWSGKDSGPNFWHYVVVYLRQHDNREWLCGLVKRLTSYNQIHRLVKDYYNALEK